VREDVEAAGAALAAGGRDLGAHDVGGSGGRDVEDAAEGIRAVEGRAGSADELELPEVVERHGERGPLLRLEEAEAPVDAVLEDEHAAVQRGIESPRVDVEVLDAALDDVDARLVPEQLGELAVRGLALDLLRGHDADRRRGLHDAGRPAGGAYDRDRAHLYEPGGQRHVDGHGAPGADVDLLAHGLESQHGDDDRPGAGGNVGKAVGAALTGHRADACPLDYHLRPRDGAAVRGFGDGSHDASAVLGGGGCRGREEQGDRDEDRPLQHGCAELGWDSHGPPQEGVRP
jgi:hypothetical protein